MNAFENFSKELDSNTVLSEEFKSRMFVLVERACREAHENGVREGRRQREERSDAIGQMESRGKDE
jgi:hypothetical protein